MQRPQGISAHAVDAPVEPGDAVRLSAALKRLAGLRATLYADWSGGAVALLDVANTEERAGEALRWTADDAPLSSAPTLFETPATPAPEEPAPLRGRFTGTDDALPPAVSVDVSWLDLVVADAPPVFEIEIADDLTIAADQDILALPPVVVAEPEPATPDIVEIDDVEPAFAVGAAPGVFDLVRAQTPDAAAPVKHAAPPIEIEDEETLYAIGAVAGVSAFVVFVETDTPAPVMAAAHTETDDIDPLTLMAFGAAPGLLAAAPHEDIVLVVTTQTASVPGDETPADISCAPFDLHTLLALTAPVATAGPAACDAVVIEEVAEPDLAVGAFALFFDTAPDEQPAAESVNATAVEEPALDIDVAFGAAPALAALIDLVPARDVTPPTVRAFDPMSLVDDALADAFDALVCAPDPIDPFDAAWTPDAYAVVDHGAAAQLAACETHLWALPRHVPCIETFLATPNHEIAVRITRALRVRANVLEARAFADPAAFGFLRTKADAQAFWFLADALHDAASLSAGDADVDASFADWRMSDEGLVVVTAPDNAHPKRPPPLISEAELDALFAHVDDAQSRVVLDDLGDDPTWNDTFWCDVDTYLEEVSETMDPAVIDYIDDAGADPFDSHDIEVRAAPVAAPTTTFFWMPGDDFDLVVDGDGGDLFIVGASETPAVVLVEDGSTYAMRTGQTARMDEVVVSLSFDAWRDIDGMQWRRVATLTGIAQVRVEQNVANTRQTVVAGSFFATTLEDDGVRLVLSGDEGDVDYPVIRVGGMSLDGDWGFAPAKPEADALFA